MKIGNREIGLAHPPFVIAEIGVNHDGSFERARELIEQAKQAGADAVKFQYFTADTLLSRTAKLAVYQQTRGETDPLAMLRRLELTVAELRQLAAHARGLGLYALVTVFSLELVASARQMPWDAFKSASPDIINLPLLTALHRSGLPLIVSTGAATISEIIPVIKLNLGAAYLHCVSAYPVLSGQAQLAGIRALDELLHQPPPQFSIPVGYSDHTSTTVTAGRAVAAGASILEKHFTDDVSRRGPDHGASLEPSDFAVYVEEARAAWEMMGERRIAVQAVEQDVRAFSRQSIVTTRALEAHTSITRADITLKRPGTGLPPSELDCIIGKSLHRDVAADVPLTATDFASIDSGEH